MSICVCEHERVTRYKSPENKVPGMRDRTMEIAPLLEGLSPSPLWSLLDSPLLSTMDRGGVHIYLRGVPWRGEPVKVGGGIGVCREDYS